ncbi:MAG TPA: hypothetical protein VFQ02_05850 [Nitrospira sp.]|nr:hypothetical protein [Nitrospira sp.]
MIRARQRAIRRQAAKDAAFFRYADSLSEEEKLAGLVNELVSECLATGLSVADAEKRLITKAVADLQGTDPQIYGKASRLRPRAASVWRTW